GSGGAHPPRPVKTAPKRIKAIALRLNPFMPSFVNQALRRLSQLAQDGRASAAYEPCTASGRSFRPAPRSCGKQSDPEPSAIVLRRGPAQAFSRDHFPFTAPVVQRGRL